MNQILEWELIFCMELVKYLIAYTICTKQSLSKRMKEILITIIASFSLVLFLGKTVSIDKAYIIFVVLVLVALFVCMSGRYRERIWQSLVIFLSVTAIDSVIENVAKRVLSLEELSKEQKIIAWDGISVVCMALILGISFVGKIFLSEKKIRYSKGLVQCSVIFADICLCLCASFLFRDINKGRAYFLLGMLSLVAVIFLGSQILRILEINHVLENAVEQERLINSFQKEYYQAILRNEEETRKYRHDMKNHFMVLEAYLQKDKPKEAEEYIRSLMKEFMKTSMGKYYIGNDVIDAISGYYLPLIDDFVTIDVNGTLREELGVDEVNLCTIYANLLKNAVEELQRLKDVANNDLQLAVEFITGNEFFSIRMKNSARENASFNGITTLTSKKDKKNHGIGLSNIINAIDKENGSFSLNKENNLICANVIIPIK